MFGLMRSWGTCHPCCDPKIQQLWIQSSSVVGQQMSMQLGRLIDVDMATARSRIIILESHVMMDGCKFGKLFTFACIAPVR